MERYMSIIANMLNSIKTKSIRVIGGQKFLSIQLDIINSCNLKCVHCYHSNFNNKNTLDFAGWINILDQYQELLDLLGLKPSIAISGGEPLLCTFLPELIIEIRNRWPLTMIVILTNGILIDKEKIDFFKENEVSLQVSLDGPNAETHDSVRGKGTFEKSVNNINHAISEGLMVYILTILSKRTQKHIEQFFDLGKQLNVLALNFTRIVPQGNGKQLVNSGLDGMLGGIQLRDAYKRILECSKKTGVVTNTNKPLFVLLDDSLGDNSLFGFQGLVVDNEGNLKVSSRTDFILGNIREKGLVNLFLKHPVMKKLRKGKIEICSGCQYYKKCGGDRNMSYSQYGDFLKVDPGCWISDDIKTQGRKK